MGPGQVILGAIHTLVFGAAVVAVFWIRRPRRFATGQMGTATDPQLADRIERIENAVNAIAVETERIAEGQRFLTRLLSGGELRSSEIIFGQPSVSR